MNPIKDRRKHKRIPKEIQLFAKLVAGKEKKAVSYEVPIITQNISKSGLKLSWPKGWDCPDCKKCLFWIFNSSCKIKNANNDNANSSINHFLPSGCILQIKPAYPSPEQTDAQVVWVKEDKDSYIYDIGVRFIEELSEIDL